MITISALIPTYNRATYVQRAIDSVLGQTRPVDEIVVVDDGSTDGTAEVIQSRYGSQVRLVRQHNMGVSGARRRAVAEARGDWVAFLDSDDEWVPGRNQRLFEAVARVPREVAWIFGDTAVVRGNGQTGRLFQRFGLSIQGDLEVFEDTWRVHYPFQFGILPASVIRRLTLLEVGCFSEDLRHSEDFLVGIQVASRYKFAGIPAEVTRIYRTPDLAGNSLDLGGRSSGDYFRARVIAFSLIRTVDSRAQWRDCHADAVRGLCKALAKQRKPVRLLAFQQFRLGVSTKSIAFLGVILLGRVGVRIWESFGSHLRTRPVVEDQSYSL